MSEIFQSCACFGLLLAMGSFQLARAINKRAGKEVCNPLLFATLLCGAVLLGTGTEYDVFYDNGGNILEFFLTPATICLAIPLYKQFELLKKNAGAVLAGVVEPASATPVIVEDGVLVGANAVVIEGVHVGKNAVVAAGAVVIEDVPENAVVAGCPARVVKMKDEGTTQKTALEAALRNL